MLRLLAALVPRPPQLPQLRSPQAGGDNETERGRPGDPTLLPWASPGGVADETKAQRLEAQVREDPEVVQVARTPQQEQIQQRAAELTVET